MNQEPLENSTEEIPSPPELSDSSPPEVNEWPALPVPFERNTMRLCLGMLLGSGFVSAVVVALCSRSEQTFRMVLSLIPGGGKVEIPTDEKRLALVAILMIYLTSLLYAAGLVVFRLLPFGFRLQKDLQEFRKNIKQVGPNSIDSLRSLVSAGIRKGGKLNARVQMLERAYRLTFTRAAVIEANNQLTATDETATAYALQPFIWMEWLLPILGFIGTVYGITQAVQGLSAGLSEYFTNLQLTPPVIQAFTDGFHGLAGAFQVTLLALWGLLFAGVVNFFLRLNATQTLANVDKWCHEAIGCLQEKPNSLEEMLRKGLFQTDEQGDLVVNAEGKPILKVEELVRTGLFKTNEAGELLIDEKEGKPVLRLQEWLGALEEMLRKGFFVTDDQGRLAGVEGKPILRWQEWMNLVTRGLFVTDQHGNLVLSQNDSSPIDRSAAVQLRIHKLLLNDIYEITPEQADAVAEGETDSGEQVPLRNRRERRHRDLLQRIAVLTWLMEQNATAGSKLPDDPPNSNGKIQRFPVLDPTGTPVDALTVTSEHFAVARQDPNSDFRIRTGSFVHQMGGRYPLERDNLAAPERIIGLSGLGNRLAYLSESSGEFGVTGWQADDFPVNICLDGGLQLASHAIVLMPFDRLDQVIVGAYSPERSKLIAWVPDSNGLPPRPIKEFPGSITAFAGLPGSAAACVVGTDKGYKLVLTHKSGNQEFDINVDITALAFAPDGSLWFAEQSGHIGVVNTNNKQTEPKIALSRKVRHLAVTAGRQIIAVPEERQELFIMDMIETKEARRVPFTSPITALAVSPEGHNLLLGHKDGSVFYLDTSGKI